MRSAYEGGTRLASIVLCALGLAMVVSTLARGGGPLALGVVVGICFTLLGAGRLYLARRG